MNKSGHVGFNKIAIQGTAQMAADKEAVGLSCSYEIIVYSVLKHNINTARMQFIPLINHPLRKEYFLTFNLLCHFTSAKLCPLVILPVLILQKYIRVYIFLTIRYLNNLLWLVLQVMRDVWRS